MSSIQYEITLDLKRDFHQVLVMKEGDVDSREIIATIVDNGKPFDISGCTAKFKWHKPDHKYVFNDCIIQEGKVHIECDEQMLVVGGLANVEVVLYDIDGQTVVSTMKFDVSIKESVISNKDIESIDEFGTLNDLILENSNTSNALKQLETEVSAAEAQRVINENNRIKNETNRIDAETNRETNTADAITKVNETKKAAVTATNNANDATTAATKAKEAADEATKEANNAIETMKTLMKDDNLVHADDLGVAGGVATLDENGNIPSSQLPSFIDDVLDGTYNSDNDQFLDLEGVAYTPESGKIYIDVDTRTTYRWSGTTYVSIGSSLTLGTTSSTAYAGDKGLALEERVTDIEEYHNNIPAKDIKFNNTGTSILGANVQDAIVELTAEATHTKAGLLSAEDKKLIDNYADIQVIDITLYASNWIGSESPYSQIVTVDGISSYNNCSVEMPSTATTDELYAMTGADVSYDESIGFTFTVDEKPTIDIPIQLCVGTSMNVVEVPEYIGESPVLGVKGNNETDYRNGYVNVTAENIGLGNVPNVVTNDQTPTYEEASELANLTSGEKLSIAMGKIARAIKGYMSHILIKGSTSGSGHVALSDSSAVTDSTGLALPATEKNASIGGTLANQIDALNETLTNKANISSTFIDRGWITNGASVNDLSIGHWSCNPNALPSQGVPDGFSTYGSLHITDGSYRQITYIDVFGNIAVYGTNQGTWNILANQENVNTLVSNSKVKSKVITFSGVTTTQSTSFFNNYTYWGYVGGVTDEIDSLRNAGYTILGGFIIGGLHNDSSLSSNATNNIGVITGSSTYYNVPYSFYAFSSGYQTVHVRVCVLYI